MNLIEYDMNKYELSKSRIKSRFYAERKALETRVELLLESDTFFQDLNIQDNVGFTALIKASQIGYTKFVRLLLDAGAEVNIQNNEGKTALIWASQKGYIDIIRLLLEVDANPNIIDYAGNTALIEASQMQSGRRDNRHIEIIRLLLDAGADLYIRNNEGMIAYDVALINYNYRIANLLGQQMEKIEKATTQFQSRIRGKQTRRRIRTQTAKQNLAFTKGLEDRPLIYGRHVRYEPNIDQLISEKLSSMSYNPEVARRMEEEEKMLPYTDWLQEFSQYGSGKHRRRNRNKKYTRNRFY